METALWVVVGFCLLSNLYTIQISTKPRRASRAKVKERVQSTGPLVFRRQKERKPPKALDEHAAYLAEIKEQERAERD